MIQAAAKKRTKFKIGAPIPSSISFLLLTTSFLKLRESEKSTNYKNSVKILT
jgi:hypothetical protein